MRWMVPRPPVYLPALLSLLLACGPGEVTMGPSTQLEHASAATLLAAGDIAGCSEKYNDEATSAMLVTLAGTVAALGDVVQKDGAHWEYRKCYHPTWGRVLSRTRPSPGNHDYRTAQAAAYYKYFGSLAGPSGRGWYTYRLGAWRIYSLNSERNIAQQAAWLQQQLAATPSKCVLAYWHRPLYTSGRNPGESSVRPLFDVLYKARAEVVLSGHNHNYERFAPQDADGRAKAAGIRQFVVGTGGAPLEAFVTVQPNSQVRRADMWGVLKLRLYQDSYSWEFLPVGGGERLDSGSGVCQ
jgi:hypothetical protein